MELNVTYIGYSLLCMHDYSLCVVAVYAWYGNEVSGVSGVEEPLQLKLGGSAWHHNVMVN